MAVKKLMVSALAGMVAVGFSVTAEQAFAAKADMEKCYGVVKAGKNDCGTSEHACAGQSTKNQHGMEWVFIPKGTCGKLHNGSLEQFDESKKER